MKKIVFIALALLACGQMKADGVKTAGDGTTYSFEKLSQTAGSCVTKEGDIYIVTGCDTISAGDHFKIDEGVEVRFGDDGELLLQGTADLQAATARTLLTRSGESETCFGITVQNEESMTPVSGLDFQYVGLRNYSGKGMEVSDCTFEKHNGTQSAALFLGTDGAEFIISECRFDSCMKAAIGGAANFMCPVAIDHCQFYHNSQANGNIPQLNLTASTDVSIVNCTLEGDSTKYMSGGIAVANWYGVDGLTATISNCEVRNSRYGLTTMGIMDVYIIDNQLINNRYEQNPMNGGSAISLYDPYYKQKVYISGNRLEKSIWGITVIGCGDVNIGKTEVGEDADDYNPGGNVFVDNGFDGNLYDLYNNSVNTVWAQGNTWNVATQDSTSIEGVIFHKNDDASLGEVIFMPAATESGIKAQPLLSTPHTGRYTIGGVRMEGGRQPKGIYIEDGKKKVVR